MKADDAMDGLLWRILDECSGFVSDAETESYVQLPAHDFQQQMFEKDLKNAFIISRLGWHEKSLLYEFTFLIKFNDAFWVQAEELKCKLELQRWLLY